MKNLSFKILAISIGLAAIVSSIAIAMALTPDVTDHHIVIQAIEQNPPGDSNRYEWVMLYNPTDNSVNISNWTLVSHFWRGTNTTVANTTLYPKKYLTVIPDRRWLHDEDALIMLIDAEGNVIDKTPVFSDRHDDERIWKGIPLVVIPIAIQIGCLGY